MVLMRRLAHLEQIIETSNKHILLLLVHRGNHYGRCMGGGTILGRSRFLGLLTFEVISNKRLSISVVLVQPSGITPKQPLWI